MFKYFITLTSRRISRNISICFAKYMRNSFLSFSQTIEHVMQKLPFSVKKDADIASISASFFTERVGFEPTVRCRTPDFEFFESLGKHRKSVSLSRKITEAQKQGSARLSTATYNPKAAQTQEKHRLEIGSKVLSKFSPGGRKTGTLERTQERTDLAKGIRDSSCR